VQLAQGQTLRRRLTAFQHRDHRWARALHIVRSKIQLVGWRAHIFGGTLRDLATISASHPPRDLDLVIENVEVSDLERVFRDYVVRKTRFGGLNLRVLSLPVDVWPLHRTWAFAEGIYSSADITELPRTTFLNVEAVTAELDSKKGKERSISEFGFFAGLEARVLEVNLLENPYPALCIVRAFATAIRLNFRVGPVLARFLMREASRVTNEELEQTQFSHYGSLKVSPLEIRKQIRHIQDFFVGEAVPLQRAARPQLVLVE
jgi:hypothetical protein